MTRAGLLAAVVVADLLLGALTAAAMPSGATDVPAGAGPWSRPGPAPQSEQQALALLQTAARAGRDLTYTGRQVLAWAGDQSGSALAVRPPADRPPVAGSSGPLEVVVGVDVVTTDPLGATARLRCRTGPPAGAGHRTAPGRAR